MDIAEKPTGSPLQPKQEDSDYVEFDWRRFVISTFVIWQVLCVCFWLLPGFALKNPFLGPLQRYMWFAACDQNWNMFAPNPAGLDVYLSANITYQNGTVKSWTFPRMHTMSYAARYQAERFRKLIEYARQDAFSSQWPYLARFAALSNNPEPQTNPVVHVDLVRHWLTIPPPGTRMPPYTVYIFYRADFPQGSLNTPDPYVPPAPGGGSNISR